MILEPSTVNICDNTACNEALDVIATFYGKQKTVKVIKGNLTDDNLIEEVKEVSCLLNEDKLREEWPMIRGMIRGSYSKLSL
ncbi:hypothetical protein DPMN_062519 [Dreissena polymorpha]|uniref:Uncharacterized protein n=1 Tax=Dreissena polymorpha TaxID=45954 RepID=A0A9D4C9D1_DREPO|nr:hypothetical protein DPMN_062519 [Dreissena polymorpha]